MKTELNRERRIRRYCADVSLRLHKVGRDDISDEPVYQLIDADGMRLRPTRPMLWSEVLDEVRARRT